MKSRRVLAMILVLVFVFAFMAMSASAVMPRATCSACGSGEVTFHTTLVRTVSQETVPNCSRVSGYHIHSHVICQNHHVCRSCGATWAGVEYPSVICRG